MPESEAAREKRLARKRERYQANKAERRAKARIARQAKREAKLRLRAARAETIQAAAIDGVAELAKDKRWLSGPAKPPADQSEKPPKPAA